MEYKEMKKGSQEYPVVSCIIYTYNRTNVLPRAIKSVLAQTYINFELVISDDCSTDNTKELVDSFKDSRIVYTKTPENLGSSGNKNWGFSKTRGRFIVFLDDDNTFEPTYFQESVDLLDGSLPSVGGVRVGRIIVQEGGFKDYAPPITHTGFDSIDWGFMMKREVFSNCMYDPLCRADEDADFGIQFARHWQTLPIDKPLQTSYAVDEGSTCTPTPRRLEGLEYFLSKNIEDYKKHPDELRYIYRLAGRNNYRGGNKMKGLHYFWLSFLARPNLKTFMHLFWILWGWRAYDWYMDRQERIGAKLRTQEHGL